MTTEQTLLYSFYGRNRYRGKHPSEYISESEEFSATIDDETGREIGNHYESVLARARDLAALWKMDVGIKERGCPVEDVVRYGQES